ncbi:MAG: hypothetical protein FWC83_02230 [Alphaproteobacteria bacterium]|nr:hypothetical protein [Alphaproteobacteria bacterium]
MNFHMHFELLANVLTIIISGLALYALFRGHKKGFFRRMKNITDYAESILEDVSKRITDKDPDNDP